MASLIAYVFLTVDPGQSKAIIQKLHDIPKAVAREIFGPYDIVVEIERQSPAEISAVIQGEIRNLYGVTSSMTCISMD